MPSVIEPRVSFVIPAYNYAHYLPRAIDSLLDQTFDALEVIVVDDASKDNTREVVERYADDPRVRAIHHAENKGNIFTYNDGISAAAGEFVGLLSADDFCLRRDAVEQQVAVFDANPHVGFVHTAFDIVDEADTHAWTFRAWPSDCVRSGLEEFERLCFDCYVSASGTLVRAACHAELGAYDPRLPVSADWDLWLRLCTRYDVGFVAEPAFAYRVHQTNMHHSGTSPNRATSNHVLTIERAFAALPASAPENVLRLRSAAIENALLVYSSDARRGGRAGASWRGLVDAARQSPGLMLRPRWYGAAARTGVLALLGRSRYEQLAEHRAKSGNHALV
jgi:GT2 family glycosyltransferase